MEKAQATMDVLGTQYRDAFRQQNIVAIAYPTMPIPAPLLPTEGDGLPATFEIHGRQYPITVTQRNPFVAPVYRAPGLSIPAGLTSDGLPAGLEIDGLPGTPSPFAFCVAPASASACPRLPSSLPSPARAS